MNSLSHERKSNLNKDKKIKSLNIQSQLPKEDIIKKMSQKKEKLIKKMLIIISIVINVVQLSQFI